MSADRGGTRLRMPATDVEDEITAAPEVVEAPEPPRPARPARWWASPDWWLRTTASAAVGRIVGAAMTGAGLLAAWLVARALGAL